MSSTTGSSTTSCGTAAPTRLQHLQPHGIGGIHAAGAAKGAQQRIPHRQLRLNTRLQWWRAVKGEQVGSRGGSWAADSETSRRIE